MLWPAKNPLKIQIYETSKARIFVEFAILLDNKYVPQNPKIAKKTYEIFMP